jgi:shikimate kinase
MEEILLKRLNATTNLHTDRSDKPGENILLIGAMGSGKTIVGQELAQKLEMLFVDTDSEIAAKTGNSIQEIFQRYGEQYFRKLEESIIPEILKEENTVISLGGGSVTVPGLCEEIFRRGISVWLKTRPDVIIQRLHGQIRPPLDNIDPSHDLLKSLEHLLTIRAPLYSRADQTIVTDGKTVSEIVLEIKGFLI